MSRFRVLATASLLASLILVPALLAAPPAFEAADIHPSPERLHPHLRGRFIQDHVVLRDASLTDLIAAAYSVEPSDILGGPAWMDFDRFDINARPPDGTNPNDNQASLALLRSLLADRFGLVARVDKRPLPAFVLTVAKPGKLKPAADASEGQGCQFHEEESSQSPGVSPPLKITCHNMSMSGLAELLHNIGSPYFNRPVVDQTNLKGQWDIELQWSYNKPTGGDGTTLPDALDKQLGLKVQSRPVPTSVVVVSSVNRKPTANLPGIEKLLPPPPPAQFDVAVIHEANPDEKHFNLNIEGNRVTIQYATLQTLIYQNFDMPPGKIENKPKWLDDQHYDIVGTVASTSPTPPKPGENAIDEEDVKEMIRSLLVDRFKLATHAGSQPSAVYALLATNPKMKKASDSEHAGCVEGPGPDGKDPRIDNPSRNRLISCQNMTMAQFATELHRLASGFIPAPVIDSTNLPTAYDFTLSFSKAGLLHTPTAAPSPAASAGGSSAAPMNEAADPGTTGAPPISLFDALQQQLGLKLEKRDNVNTPTLVIDHVEEHPSEN